MTANLKYAQSLLFDIARDLRAIQNENGHAPLGFIEVAFCEQQAPGGISREIQTFDLPGALDVIANDLYFDAEANWADANRAIVRMI